MVRILLFMICLNSIPYATPIFKIKQTENTLCKLLKEKYNNAPFEGARIIKAKDKIYLISLSIVNATSNSSAITLSRIGTVKARRNLLVFLEGSDITSTKTLITTETITNNERASLESFSEQIKESAIGFVEGTSELCNWFSEDKKEFIQIIYKEIKK